MSAKLLFSDDSDGEEGGKLKINKQFAEKYESYRRSEELKNLKDLAKEVEKYESDSSEISSSDELAKPSAKSTEYVTKILEAVKSGKGKELLQDHSFLKQNPLVKKKKKKDRTRSLPVQPLTYDSIKRQIEEPEVQVASGDSDDDAMDLIKQSTPANDSKSRDEPTSEALDSVKARKGKLHRKKEKSSESENSGVSQSDESEGDGGVSGTEQAGSAVDEEQQDNEHADGEPSIRETLAKFAKEAAPHKPTSYPYKLKTTDRIKDTKTHDKKVAYAARKKEAKRLFMEREKEALKIKKDMLIERLNAIKKTSGQEKLAFDDKELDEDFDPEQHEQKMQQMYGEDFGSVDAEKPQFEYDEFIDGDMPNYDEVEFRGKNIPDDDHKEEDEASSEEEEEETPTSGHIQGPRVREEKKKRRRKGRKKPNLLEAVKQEKPIFNSNEHNFEEFFDEYYAQHCEDVIAGGIKCRFKYRKVEPNNYGLSFEDVLMADGQELKNWNGLTNILRYDRTAAQERREAAYFNRNRKSVKHMAKMFPSLYTYSPEREEEETREKTEEEKKSDKNFKKKLRKEQKKLDVENANETSKRKLSEDDNDGIESTEAAHENAAKKPKNVTVSSGSASENGVKVRPKHVTISSEFAKRKKNIKERLDLEKRDLNPLAQSKIAKSVDVIVGDALSTVLKLDPERLAAYSFNEPTRLQKFALYKEKMIEMGHDPDEVIDVVKSKKRERMEERMQKQGPVVCEQEREIRKEEKRRKRREKVQQQIAERKKRAAEKKAKNQKQLPG
ncbi:Kri1-like C-terminal [Trinorchestia longiramus]|nr:Kri1-like C-terminal [Trinorchestia longiramus]